MKNYPLEELCIEIVEQCPLECLHCSSASFLDGKQKLSLELVKGILKDFKELGGAKLELSVMVYNKRMQTDRQTATRFVDR